MSRVDREVPVYPIGVVQKLTGLSGRQIRYYETVGILAPYRTKGNQRLYSPDDVDLLMEVKRLLGEGLNIEGVKARLVERENAKSGAEDEGDTTPDPIGSSIDHDYIITQMRAGTRLSSLFPVNNQAALSRFLHHRKSDE